MKNLGWIFGLIGALIGTFLSPGWGALGGAVIGWTVARLFQDPTMIIYALFTGPLVIFWGFDDDDMNIKFKCLFFAAIIVFSWTGDYIVTGIEDKEMYEYALQTKTIEACDQYLKKYGKYHAEIKDLKEDIKLEEAKRLQILREQRDREEAKKWSTDNFAWREATRLNTSFAYKKYLELFPNGIRVNQAKKSVIDREVDEIFGKDHGRLPAMDKALQGSGSSSDISVYNNTSYTLTIRYSGAESKSIDIPSRSRQSISLINGTYRIAASVNAANVRNYAGSESLTGGNYNVEYYINTTNVSSYRPRNRR